MVFLLNHNWLYFAELGAVTIVYLPSPSVNSGTRTRKGTVSLTLILQQCLVLTVWLIFTYRYYLEPGYDKQRTTKEGELASRNYSERAYVFSRLFIRRALQDSPISSFEDELRWLYLRPDGGRLPCIIDQAVLLIKEGEKAFGNGGEGKSDDAYMYGDESSLLAPLSPGSAMKLKKIIDQLQEIYQRTYKN